MHYKVHMHYDLLYVISRAIFKWPKNLKKLTLFYQKIDFIDLMKQWNERIEWNTYRYTVHK